MSDYALIYRNLREAIVRRPDLRFNDFENVEDVHSLDGFFLNNAYCGFCYIASQALTFLVPQAELYTDDKKWHYWNKVDGEIIDLTKDQFKFEYNYSMLGRKVPRPSKPTKRVVELLKEAGYGETEDR